MESAVRLKPVEDDAAASSSILSQVTVLHERDGGNIEARVPIDFIYREDVPVDQDHVDELAESIQAEKAVRGEDEGQLSPILLGEVPGEDKFYIIDGFHRDAALHQLGHQDIIATIRVDSTMDDIVDLRILTANTHSSVTFARIVEWIQDAWQKSPWADSLTAAQAFALSQNNSSGRQHGLDPDETKSIKAWAEDKCDRWRMSKGSVYASLSTAQVADPALVKEARRRTGKNALTAVTPQHLSVIAKALPHRYAEQRLVAEVAKANNFNLQMTRAVVEMLQPTSNIEEARTLTEQTDWTKIRPSYGKTTHKVVRSEVREEEARHRETYRELLATELELSKIAIENCVLRDRYAAPTTAERAVMPAAVAVDLGGDERFVELLTPFDSEERTGRLLDRAEAVGPRFIELLESHGCSQNQARVILNAATEMIAQDIEDGGLSFVRLEKDAIFDRLIKTCIEKSIRKREDTSSPPASETGAESLHTTVGLKSVIEALPHMNNRIRRVLALNNFFGLPPRSVAQILEVPIEASRETARRINLRLESMDSMLKAVDS